jgi:predicted RNA-binding Zn-ribbon protein involved in translation (DUF1610 family)
LNDIDDKTLVEVSRRFIKLRRLYWRFFFGAIVLFAMLVTANALDSQRHPVLYGVLTVMLPLGFLVCCLGVVVGSHLLLHFICPRCGERFILSSFSSWPSSVCKHCGLKLNVGEHAQLKPQSAHKTLIDDL